MSKTTPIGIVLASLQRALNLRENAELPHELDVSSIIPTVDVVASGWTRHYFKRYRKSIAPGAPNVDLIGTRGFEGGLSVPTFHFVPDKTAVIVRNLTILWSIAGGVAGQVGIFALQERPGATLGSPIGPDMMPLGAYELAAGGVLSAMAVHGQRGAAPVLVPLQGITIGPNGTYQPNAGVFAVLPPGDVERGVFSSLRMYSSDLFGADRLEVVMEIIEVPIGAKPY